MMPGFLASLVAAALIGFLSLSCLRWRQAEPLRSRVLLVSLAAGMGLGLSSAVFFLWLCLAGAPSSRFPVSEFGVVIALAGVAFHVRTHRGPGGRPPLTEDATMAPPSQPLLSLALWLSAGCATIAFLAQSAASPQGGWDAWMTWNMHARAIYRGGDHWRAVLTGLPAWSHPDYPLLVPASVARIWTYMGQATQLAPVTVALLFTFATVGLLFASVARLRSRTQGGLAALVLLATKFFILQGASQFADVPFGFFMLATFALLALSEVWTEDRPRLLALAGVSAGLAAWTKNEGLLLLPAVLLGYGLVVGRARGWRTSLSDVRAFAIGLAPVLALVVGFKIWLAPANDLMSDQGLRQTAARLFEGSRYVQVAGGLVQGFLEVSVQGILALLLVGYLFCAGPAPAGSPRLGARIAIATLSLVLAGYVAVLLTAPAPLLATNIRSINRLLLQLWPSVLLAYFLSIRTAEEAGLFGSRLSQADRAARGPDRSLLPLSEAS
jgi:dolichyl-phosphate-mannose-protein mannosyltransferase